jgi:GNAT superfamily N-acetyltransferase
MSVAPDEPKTQARIAVADPARLDDCRALWLSLRDHHAGTDPGMGPVRDDEDSWGRARAEYGTALSTPDGFLVLAEADGAAADAPLGCAFVAVKQGSPTWTAADRFGEVDVLAVAPEARGLGIGAALLRVVQEELDRRGAHEIRLIVTAGNAGAQAFYREVGFDTFAHVMRRVSPPSDRQPPR